MMKTFWNVRYIEDELAYGEAPNQFFAEQLEKIKKPGRILLPLEGQGRNAVYAAKLGWQVTAFDFSEEAKKTAESLAMKEGVKVDYHLSAIEDFDFGIEQYDVIALIFAHLPIEVRKIAHQKMIKALKNDGQLILEGFEKKQILFNSGGPKKEAMLYDIVSVLEDFSELRTALCKECFSELNEGKYHHGKAALVRYIGVK